MSNSTHASSVGSDDLLRDFRGRGLVGALLLTVAVHVVLILATSLPWLRSAIAGGKADLTEEQRLEAAVKEATTSLQAIAKEHGVRPQDLGSRFASGGKPAATTKAGGGTKTAGAAPAADETGKASPSAAPVAQPDERSPAGQPPAAEPQPATPPGPALPEVKDDLDLFK